MFHKTSLNVFLSNLSLFSCKSFSEGRRGFREKLAGDEFHEFIQGKVLAYFVKICFEFLEVHDEKPIQLLTLRDAFTSHVFSYQPHTSLTNFVEDLKLNFFTSRVSISLRGRK
jgi:hypothetical protein